MHGMSYIILLEKLIKLPLFVSIYNIQYIYRTLYTFEVYQHNYYYNIHWLYTLQRATQVLCVKLIKRGPYHNVRRQPTHLNPRLAPQACTTVFITVKQACVHSTLKHIYMYKKHVIFDTRSGHSAQILNSNSVNDLFLYGIYSNTTPRLHTQQRQREDSEPFSFFLYYFQNALNTRAVEAICVSIGVCLDQGHYPFR